MRLHKCKKLLKFLIEEKLIDDRQIWCYANMKARIKIQTEPIKIYGMPLVCVNQDRLFLYDNAYNTPEVRLFYSCKIDEMEDVRVKKALLRTTLSFSKGEESFELEMDEWKRFATVFEV